MPGLARIDEVCDAVVAKIEAAWTDLAAPSAVQAVDEIDIVTDPREGDVIEGRQVYVLPDAYDNPEASARGYDFNDYSVEIIIARLYRGADEESMLLKDWVRAERYWVEQTVYKPLTDVRGEKLLSESESGGLWPVSPSSVEVPFETAELRDKKLFFSVVRVTFREDVEA